MTDNLNVILRAQVGSHATGLNHANSDRDEMGVYVEAPLVVLGGGSMDNVTSRTVGAGERSGPDDVDVTLYSLRRFCQLCIKGNPTVIQLLWVDGWLLMDDVGKMLVDMRHLFFSRDAGAAHLGYLAQQRKRLTGERSRNVSRPELVAAHGYDTKFAMHALRLGMQGIEYMRHRRITLPMWPTQRKLLKEIRDGELTYTHVMSLIAAAEDELKRLVDACEAEVDLGAVQERMVKMHKEAWGWS